jgi:hypothetical protein
MKWPDYSKNKHPGPHHFGAGQIFVYHCAQYPIVGDGFPVPFSILGRDAPKLKQ